MVDFRKTPRWEKERKEFVKENSICKICGVKPSYITDHIIPYINSKELFWDRNNWQALCKSCHDRKTAVDRKSKRYRKKDNALFYVKIELRKYFLDKYHKTDLRVID